MKRIPIVLLLFLSTFVCVNSQIREYWPTNEWQTKSPEELNMDTVKLNDMDRYILTYMDYVDAFLIVKDGYLVFEKYYNSGYNRNRNHLICSGTKSVTGILTGMLLRQNYIDSIGEKIIDYFPEYKDVNSDDRLKQLTIKHMMSFTSGLNHDDDNNWQTSDIIRDYLALDFNYDPGTKFNYETPASQVISALVNKTTGKNAYQFASDELFNKLGISNVSWPSDGLGYSYGGFNSYFRPYDMLKLGYLYLNKGIWDGDTLVNPDFVELSTIAHTNGGSPHNEKYGLNWWIDNNNGYHAYFAGGYGGQFIYIIPGLDLVVAITCNLNRHRENARYLIASHVVPSFAEPKVVEDEKKEDSISIVKNFNHEKFIIYINSINNTLHVNNLDNNQVSVIKIFDVKGILKGNYKNCTKINLNGYNKGLYIVFIETVKGFIYNEKVMLY